MMFSGRFAAFGLIILLSLVSIFHVCILTGIIPFDIVWGGRLTERSQMLTFEIISLTVNLFMLLIVFVKAGFIKTGINSKFIRIVLWTMAGIFILNTIGNLFSVSQLERIIFTPLTLLLAVFSIRLALTD